MTTTLRVNEVFETLQGEGPSVGRQAVFLRLSGCNLDCAWCDTPYTWDWTGKNGRAFNPRDETTLVEPAGMADELRPRLNRAPLLVITGGEPLIQRTALAALVDSLDWTDYDGRIEVETNGTLPPGDRLLNRCFFNVSPKLAHSGVAHHRAIKPTALRSFTKRTIFKFVVKDLDDLDEVEAIVDDIGAKDTQVWIMPEGRTAADVGAGMTKLVDGVLERGWNLTPRLHVLLWGDERGR